MDSACSNVTKLGVLSLSISITDPMQRIFQIHRDVKFLVSLVQAGDDNEVEDHRIQQGIRNITNQDQVGRPKIAAFVFVFSDRRKVTIIACYDAGGKVANECDHFALEL